MEFSQDGRDLRSSDPKHCVEANAVGTERTPGRLILHHSFRNTIEGIRSAGVRLPIAGNPHSMDFGWVNAGVPEGRVENLESVQPFDVDAGKGDDLAHDPGILVSAYDESINKYSALEGTAYFTSHSLVFMPPSGYEPLTQLTMYFYTRSKNIQSKSPNLKYSLNPTTDSQKDYLDDKLDFIFSNSVRNSILLVDGPIIAGDVYTRFMTFAPKFAEHGITPVFFVKNSDSNMVIDNFSEIGKSYNSDMHWSYDTLKPGQRSCFFRYVDQRNERNSKVFTYLKVMDLSPVRVEFFSDTYRDKLQSIGPIMDLVYYLSLAQGSRNNPQPRPIAIAEAYARETMKLVNFQRLMRESGLHPTMNQERFAW